MAPPLLKGIAFSPNGDAFTVDYNNYLLEQYTFNDEKQKYIVCATKYFNSRPLALTFMKISCGFEFEGVVVTLESRNIRFVSTNGPYLEVRRTVYSYGRCTAIQAVPDTNSMLVVNYDTNSVDIINIYGVSMKRFELSDIINSRPAFLSYAIVDNREIVFLAGAKGLHVLSVDQDHMRNLVLTQRQVISKSSRFSPKGICCHGDRLFLANCADDGGSIIRYRIDLRSGQQDRPEDVYLTRSWETNEDCPLAVGVYDLNDKTSRIVISKRKEDPDSDKLTYLDLKDG